MSPEEVKKRREELEAEGFAFDIGSEGYSVHYKGKFVTAAGADKRYDTSARPNSIRVADMAMYLRHALSDAEKYVDAMPKTPREALALAIKALEAARDFPVNMGFWRNSYQLLPMLESVMAAAPVDTGIEVDRTLVLSTEHIRASTGVFIDNEDIASYSSEYGWVIYVGGEFEDDEWPDDLKAVVKFAQEKKCDYLRLDRDGPTVKELPRMWNEEGFVVEL
jgi:hypothetical protein